MASWRPSKGDRFKLFGSWLSAEDVPAAWTYDEDGLPWTDNVLAAVDLDGTWTTYKKEWQANTYTIRKEGKNFTFSLDDYKQVVNLKDPRYLDPTLPDPANADLRKLVKAINNDPKVPVSDFKPQDLAHGLAKILKITPSAVPPALIDGWEANPPTVVDPAAGGALVATWNSELGDEGMYVVEAGYQDKFGGAAEVSMDEMREFVYVKDENDAGIWQARAGWVKEEVEDLANVNTSYAIRVNENVTGPLTMRVWVTDDTANVTPPKPDTSGGNGGGTTGSSSSGGGCTIGGSGTPDPTLPAMVALGLGMLGWRRLRSRKQG